MKQNGMYWILFSPMIKSCIRKRYGRKLADRAVKNGRREYRRLVENAPELGKGNPMASNAYFAYVFVGAWLGTKKELSPDKWYRDMKKYEKWYDAGNFTGNIRLRKAQESAITGPSETR